LLSGNHKRASEECGFPPTFPGNVEPLVYSEKFQEAFVHVRGLVDEDLLKLCFNSLIMYYPNTKKEFPEHKVNQILERIVGVYLGDWSRILGQEFKSLNVLGLPASVLSLSSESQFNVSSVVLRNHLVDQNKTLQLVNSTLLESKVALETKVDVLQAEVGSLRADIATLIALVKNSKTLQVRFS
jgi:hypothetical protein